MNERERSYDRTVAGIGSSNFRIKLGIYQLLHNHISINVHFQYIVSAMARGTKIQQSFNYLKDLKSDSFYNEQPLKSRILHLKEQFANYR